MSSRTLSLGLRIVVSGGLVAWLASRVDLHEVTSSIAAIGPGEIVLILGLQFLNTVLKSYKWTKLLEADGIVIAHSTALASYLVGNFFSVFLPSSVGGDVVRAVETGRRTGRRLATMTSVAADRVLGFVAIGLMGLVAIALFGSALDTGTRISGAFIYLGVLTTGGLLFAPGPLRIVDRIRLSRLPRLERAIRGTAESMNAYRRGGRLLELTMLSIAAQAVVVIVVFRIARTVGIEADLSYFFVIVPLVALVESIPVSIYGVGLRDVSYAYLLGLVGTETARSLSLSILYVIVSVLYSLVGGLVFVFRRLAPEEAR